MERLNDLGLSNLSKGLKEDNVAFNYMRNTGPKKRISRKSFHMFLRKGVPTGFNYGKKDVS